MNNTNWRTLAEFVAVVSVVASLLFVAYELRLARTIAMTEGFATAFEIQDSVRARIVEN